jgi:hypothetical protein
MHSRVLLTGSAAYLFGSGVVLNFFPQEVAALAGLAGAPSGAVLLQVIAGLYVGMGLTNWMWRGHLLGGIYGRPIGVGNVAHFTVGAFALGRAAFGGQLPPSVWAITGVYVLFALAFAWTVFFRNPLASGGSTGSRGPRTPVPRAP